MQILKSGLTKRIIIFGLSLSILTAAFLVVNQKFYLIPKPDKPQGEVAGTSTNPLSLENKFCEDPATQSKCLSFIQDTLAHENTFSYQDVGGDVAISGKVTVNNKGGGEILLQRSDSALPNGVIRAYGTSDSNVTYGSQLGMYNGSFLFYTDSTPTNTTNNTTNTVSITNEGKLGIGTASPTNLLHVYSNTAGVYPAIKIESGSSANFPVFSLLDGRASGSNWQIENGRDGAGTGLGFYLAQSATNGTKMKLSTTGNLTLTGTLTATAKNFEINHPSKSGYKLVHSSLEGPEVGVFYRGESRLNQGKANITLPDYFEALTSKENRTVLLTPKFDTDSESISNLAASSVENGSFKVRTTDGLNLSQKFYWEVKAVRKDVPALEVEKSLEK